MALPNLSALRLAEAERRVDTEEWVQYDPSLQRVIDDEDLRECPICAEKFEPGQWLWKTNQEQGRKYYTPKWYWEALKRRNGVDPMMSDIPVSYEDVKKLVEGPQVVDRDRDYIDDPPNERQLKKLYAEWGEARKERARERRREDGVANEEDEMEESEGSEAYEERMQEEDRWWAAAQMSVNEAPAQAWMKKLLLKGLEVSDLGFLAHVAVRRARINNDNSMEQRVNSQYIQNLKIDDSLLLWAHDLTRRYSPTDLHPPLFFHMPFYSTFDESDNNEAAVSNHNPGVTYEWRVARGIGEVFDITARMHPRSQLAIRMDEAVSLYDDSGEAVSRGDSADDLFRKVVLRALLGLDAGDESEQLDELNRFVVEQMAPLDLHVSYIKFTGADELHIYISAAFMAWLCQGWGASGRWQGQLPPNPQPLPAYARLAEAVDDPDSGEWSNPESKLLWEKARDKMSRVTSAVIEHTLKTTTEEDPENMIFVPYGPFRPVESPITATRVPDNPDAVFTTVRSTEVLWYAINTP